MSGVAHALHAGREVGFFASGLGRAMIRMPIVFAIAGWLAFTVFSGISKGLSINPIETRHIRSECGLTGRAAGGPGCSLGSGEVIMTNTYDHRRTIAVMDQAAARSFQIASFFTVGAIAVAAFSFLGGSRRAPRQSRRYVGRAVDHVQHEHARAQRDVTAVKARAGKAGEWRRNRIVKRWSREAAAGEAHSDLGAIDRWVMRQAKPTKEQRTANRTAKRIGKASKKAEQAQLDNEWNTELAAIERPRLNPLDGPPLSPVQAKEYAERQVDEAEAMRRRLAAETADLFDGSTP